MKEIPQKIKSAFTITANSVDFSELSDITVYIQQGGNTFEFTETEGEQGYLEVIDDHTLQVVISKKASSLLTTELSGKLQVFVTDAYGFPQRSNVYRFSVAEVIPEAGYGI